MQFKFTIYVGLLLTINNIIYIDEFNVEVKDSYVLIEIRTYGSGDIGEAVDGGPKCIKLMYSGDGVVEVDHELLSVNTELTIYAFLYIKY